MFFRVKIIPGFFAPLAIRLVFGLMGVWWVIQVLRENVQPIAIPFRMKGAGNSLDGIAEMFLRTAHAGMNLYCSHGFQRRQSRGGFFGKRSDIDGANDSSGHLKKIEGGISE